MTKIDISIITPSYNMLDFLRCCCNSIRDQQVNYEHIVVDGLSKDGTGDWLNQQNDITSIIEKDQGMYDALNKGLRAAKGELVAYLNCDEQYLPGTLATVIEYFKNHPEVDILFSDMLLVDPQGKLLAFKKAFPPKLAYIQRSYLYLPSCGMFFRRKIIEDGIFFDLKWKSIGDMDFVVRILQKGYRPRYIHHYSSAFIITGINLSLNPVGLTELAIYRKSTQGWLTAFQWLFDSALRLQKLIHGAYKTPMPIKYQVFTLDSPNQRISFQAEHVTPLSPQYNQASQS